MLTDAACKRATCPPEKNRERYTDAQGVYLEVSRTGTKRWFWKYRYDGKEKRLALGGYPQVKPPQARSLAEDARRLLRAGSDPAVKRLAERLTNRLESENTFEAVAREFHLSKSKGWSPKYAARWIERMEKDMFPHIGGLPLRDVTAPILHQTLLKVQKRGAIETAHSLRQYSGQVFRYGIITGRCTSNPAPDLHGALEPVRVKHMAAIVDEKPLIELLRAIHDYPGQPTTKAALQLSALLFQRPGNIRMMEWAEIDFDAAMWTIPAAKMKRTLHGKENGRPHFVPLPRQAIEVLEEVKPFTGDGKYVFPSLHSRIRPMSENTVNTALRRMGFSGKEATAHGFRATARTLLVEKLNANPDVIEAQLAHGKSGVLGAAYDRTEYMEQRRKLMQLWADHLDRLREGAKIIPLRA